MITVDHEVLIRVPPAEVFEFVTNAENDNAWVGFALSAGKLSVAPIGRGTRFHQTGAILGMRIPLVWEIPLSSQANACEAKRFQAPRSSGESTSFRKFLPARGSEKWGRSS